MKKLLLTLLLPLITLSSVSYGEEINSLFGISLYENAEKYVSSNYINSNKWKNPETLSGYFEINITDKIKTKNPYLTDYEIGIDNDNMIHSIYGWNNLANLEICQEVALELVSSSEEKYQIDFKYREDSYPAFKIYTHSDNYANGPQGFTIQCLQEYDKPIAILQIYLMSLVLAKEINKFYNAGL